MSPVKFTVLQRVAYTRTHLCQQTSNQLISVSWSRLVVGAGSLNIPVWHRWQVWHLWSNGKTSDWSPNSLSEQYRRQHDIHAVLTTDKLWTHKRIDTHTHIHKSINTQNACTRPSAKGCLIRVMCTKQHNNQRTINTTTSYCISKTHNNDNNSKLRVILLLKIQIMWMNAQSS